MVHLYQAQEGREQYKLAVPGTLRAEETSPAWRRGGQGLLSGSSRSPRVLQDSLHLLNPPALLLSGSSTGIPGQPRHIF